MDEQNKIVKILTDAFPEVPKQKQMDEIGRSRPLWPNLAKFFHFGNSLNILVNFEGLI